MDTTEGKDDTKRNVRLGEWRLTQRTTFTGPTRIDIDKMKHNFWKSIALLITGSTERKISWKVTVARLVKKFTLFCSKTKGSLDLSGVCHWIPCWDSWNHSAYTCSSPSALTYIFVLFFLLCLELPTGLFLSGSSITIWFEFLKEYPAGRGGGLEGLSPDDYNYFLHYDQPRGLVVRAPDY